MTLRITADNIDLTTLTSVTGPKISLIDYPGDDLATLPAGGATVTIAGSGFVNGCQVLVDSVYATTVTFVSSTSISFTTPAMSAGTYPIYVINPDGGTAIAIPGISYSGVPAFSTSSGSLGTVYEGAAFSSNIAATSDSAVTYAIDSGALPTGFSLNANTGAIAGNVGTITNSTTYNFTIKATDAELQDTNRSFSITTNPDTVTFNTPAGNQSYSNSTIDSFSLTLNATSAAGRSVTYTANTLPGGITLSGNVISGTFNAASSVVSLITATAATTLKTATRLLTWAVTSPTLTVEYLLVAGGGGGGGSGSENGYVGAGGGGAGGLLTGNITSNFGVSHTITVGAGGTGGSAGYHDTSYGTGAGSSIARSGLTTITSYGGGTGGWGGTTSSMPGGNGGSGGGIGAADAYNKIYATGGKGVYPGSTYINAARQGYDGAGYNTGSGNFGGGASGGGAGAAGNPGSSGYGGSGGVGIEWPTGSGTYYAGGGGGGSWRDSGGGGGNGGGGAGGSDGNMWVGAPGNPGTTNTGGGGGGALYNGYASMASRVSRPGGAGGSGVVILRYPDSNPAASATTGSPTVTVSGGYRVYKFTSSGSITF